jgi:hypothetical protein
MAYAVSDDSCTELEDETKSHKSNLKFCSVEIMQCLDITLFSCDYRSVSPVKPTHTRSKSGQYSSPPQLGAIAEQGSIVSL